MVMKFTNTKLATTVINVSNVSNDLNGAGMVFEYPLNNKEFPARIVFAVIPNLDNGGIGAATSDLVQKGIRVGTNITSDPEVVTNEEESTLGVDGKGGKSFTSSIASRTKKWVEKQAAFYGSVGEEPFHDLSLDVTTDEVRLYLPRAISINDAASYDTGFQLGTLGGVAEMALSSGNNVLGAITGSVIGTAVAEGKSFMGGSGMNAGMADILAQIRIAKMGDKGAAVAGGMTAASKVTTNPNTKAMFKDVPLRSFSFSFTLIPSTAREAQEINNIVKLFRTELYPTTLSAGKVRVGYKFPNRFKITLKSGISKAEKDKRRELPDIISNDVTAGFNDNLGVRFLPCYLTAFGAVYNAGSSLLHNDGQFNQVDITLAFTETRALTKADVRDGGY